MRFFLDTEFIESGRHHPLQLISIGIVAANGQEYYAVSSEFDPKSANAWVTEHVLPQLDYGVDWKPLAQIAFEVRDFVKHQAPDQPPEFWGYYADYDWVVFCQMFGTMMDLPQGYPMYCRDLRQWCDQMGKPCLPPQKSQEHNALNDARWNRSAWVFLNDLHVAETAAREMELV